MVVICYEKQAQNYLLMLTIVATGPGYILQTRPSTVAGLREVFHSKTLSRWQPKFRRLAT